MRGIMRPQLNPRVTPEDAPPGHRELGRRGKQRAATGQQAIRHRPAQHMDVGVRDRRPRGVDVGLAVGDHCYHRSRCQHRLRLLCGVYPAHRLPLRQRTMVVWRRVHPVTAPDFAPYQACPRAGQRPDPWAQTRPTRGAATIACTSTPYALPFPTGPRPRRRCAVVGNFTSEVSWIARTCRPAQASPVRSDQPSISLATVTFGLEKNRPARSSPPRLPPRRRKHTVLRTAICSRIAAPLYRGVDLRMSPATFPWRLLSVGGRRSQNPTRAASGKQRIHGCSAIDITCVHALAPSQGQAPATGGAGAKRA